MKAAKDREADDGLVYPDKGEAALLLIKRAPNIVTAQLRGAWNVVSAHVASGATESELHDALDQFALVVKDVYYALGVCQQDEAHDKLSLQVWSRMYDAGLPDLMQDIIMQSTFWTLPRPIIVNYLFAIHVAVSFSSHLEYAPLRPRVLARSDTLWAAMWDNRHLIAAWLEVRPAHLGSNSKEIPPVQMLLLYHALYQAEKIPVTITSRMPHFALYAWATAECQSERFSAVYACDNGPNHPATEAERFLREVVVGGVGIEACMARLEEVLRGEEPWQWSRLEDVKECVRIFSVLMRPSTPESLALLGSAGQHCIPHLLTGIARKYALQDGLRECPIFYHSTFLMMDRFTLYDLATKRFAAESRPLLISGEDIIAMMACAIDLMAAHGSDPDLDKDAETTIPLIESFITVKVEQEHKWAESVQNAPLGSLSKQDTEIIAGYRRGMEKHWWPSLRAISLAKRRCKTVPEDLVRLGTLWTGFGALLGRDARRELERDNKNRASRCTRLECEFNRKPGDTEKPFMSCKGCRVAYCSRECQVKDWRKGHKNSCKRLKDGEVN
ncbi:unnamed protein product [Peniophora sp. CBMAI 1063]|nr:unnamed protein product [Peniophora sp. CBMAI 1063]